MSAAFEPPGDCPNCGEYVPPGAPACPHCGADEHTGWSEETYLDGIDLPDDGEERAAEAPRSRIPAWLTLLVVVALVLVFSGLWAVLR